MSVRIVGIDCATKDARIGLALGEVIDGRALVTDARLCPAESTAVAVVAEWLQREPATRTLLAIDAPLGWPRDLGDALVTHRAGAAIRVEPNVLFRRDTDRFVHRHFGKTPLDVGADRIARTAHAALALLDDLRQRLHIELPLAWDALWTGTAAIEVYPAATLLARRMAASGYKKKHHTSEREVIVRDLRRHLQLPESCAAMLGSADALDAAICVLAGADFARGYAHPPVDIGLATKEGWIWFASPSALADIVEKAPPDDGL